MECVYAECTPSIPVESSGASSITGTKSARRRPPFHAGLGFVCDFDKGVGFIGREALLDIRDRGVESLERRLASVRLADPAPMLFGHEPILRDGEPVGYVTSGAFGHSLGVSVGLGWLCCTGGVSSDWVAAGRYEVLVESEAVGAIVSLRPFVGRDGRPRADA